MKTLMVFTALIGLSVVSAQAAPQHRNHRPLVMSVAAPTAVMVIGLTNATNANWDQVMDKPKDQNSGN
jgi:hypothetical protein